MAMAETHVRDIVQRPVDVAKARFPGLVLHLVENHSLGFAPTVHSYVLQAIMLHTDIDNLVFENPDETQLRFTWISA
ncbi:hypothetical protein BDZ89DRAFT_1145536 [Hymenopellis radicata]|nr:hypothetical protein BDZ89DRAFT_1145533 [Hymenopellis radicata]KAF9004523.1 hypothetical protein BDZ89DRAFT_1145536 [Hymenopellis radicata]